MFLLIIYLIVLGIIFVAGLVLLGSFKTKGGIARALNMSLFSVALPRDPSTGQGQGQQRTEKELISVMEQLYSSFSNIHSKGWNKFLYGEPYISLEMAVHHVGEEIFFYMAVPKTYEQIFEKQVHGFFPTAEVEKVKDYNIFNPDGVSVGAHVRLSTNPILPFKTYQVLQADPLSEVATALSKLEKEGEGAAVQILMRPSHRKDLRSLAQKVARQMQSGLSFKEGLSAAKKKPKKPKPNEPQSNALRVVTPFEEEIIKGIQSKAVKPLFDTNIRVVVSAGSEMRAKQILNDIEGSLVQFSSTDMNSLKAVGASSGSLNKLLFNFSFRLFDDSYSTLLSSEEITSLYHFPLASTIAPRIKFLKSKTAEPPVNLPQEGVILGRNVFRGVTNMIRMTRNDRRRHFYVLGQTGTGKSTAMENMIYQDISNGDGVAFIDPHGTAVEKILGTIPPERMQDVIVFDPADVGRPIGLNMLEYDIRYPEQKTFIVNELLSIFQKLFLAETMGPMFDQYFRNAVLLLLDDYQHERPTLVNVPRVLTDDQYRRDKLSRETNPIVKNFWEFEAEKAGGEAALANMAPYITSKINGFIANEYLRPILSQAESSFNFREVIDQRKILLVNLSKGRIGDINANLLGMLIVGKLLIAALSRVDMPEDQRNDFYLYIDEFQNFTTDSIATILAEARKYKLNLIIAHQFVKQLVDKIRDAVFGNVGSMAVFRVGADDAEFLKNQFEPVFTPQDLLNIDNFNCYVKLLINNQVARPFNIRIEAPQESNPEIAQKIKELSRLKYGKPNA
ncbi:MAG: type IV secretion system DNA-binding domain-containing protein [Candidatus Colwellbacteria bacterium]|nr:type IV secretion system DNA-binding domain-containing protein [Candidatus Colwellbacteria bacterium]